MNPWSGIDIKSFSEACVEELETKKPVITPGGRRGNDRSTGSRSNRENWVERTSSGRLPQYIRIVRNGLMREGHPEGRATALAVAAIKRWARGGDNVSPKVQAAAAKALAEWEKMKAEKSYGADPVPLGTEEWFNQQDQSEQKASGDEMTLEYKTVGVSGLKELKDEGDGIIEAFVSVTGLKDRVKDIIEPGAYQKTLKERMPKGVWSHDWDKPVSKALDISEVMPGSSELPKTLADGTPWPTGAGALKIKMQFNLNTQRGKDAYEDVKFFGDQQEWSIGYNVPRGKAVMDTKADARRIHELDLFEFSPVLFGAMPNARTKEFSEVQMEYKSLQGVDVDEWLEELKELRAHAGIETKSFEPGDEGEHEYEAEDQEIDFEAMAEKGLFSAENISLLKKAADVIDEILEVATGAPIESKKFDFDIESKEFMDIVDAVKVAEVLDETAVDEFEVLAEEFDEAVKSDDLDGAESSAEAILDTIEDYLDDASDKGAEAGLKALAGAVASIMTKTFGGEENPEDEAGLGEPSSGATDDADKEGESEEKAFDPTELETFLKESKSLLA